LSILRNNSWVNLKIGEMKILINSPQREFSQKLKKHFEAFVEENSQPDFTFEIEKFQKLPLKNFSEPFSLTFKKDILWVQRASFEAVIDFQKKKIVVKKLYPGVTAVENLLRFFLSWYLISAQRGVLVHASSLLWQGRGYLFCGESGAGKSTILTLCRQALPLNDELSLIQKKHTQYYLYSTPFLGKEKYLFHQRSSPLERIYFLKKANLSLQKKLSQTEAIFHFLPRIVLFSQQKEVGEQVLQIVSQIIDKVDAYELFFKKNDFIIPFFSQQ
jgi:ABC-type glutathione transport system ATPase component